MAANTNASTGMIVSLSLASLFFVVFFVLTVIFYSKSVRLERELQEATDRRAEAVQQSFDRFEQLAREAGRGKGVVDLLLERSDALNNFLIGSATGTPEDVRASLIPLLPEGVGTVRQGLSQMRSRLNALENDVTRLNTALNAARNTLEAKERELTDIRAEYDRSRDSLQTEVQDFGTRAVARLESLEEARAENEERVSRIRSESAETIELLETTLRERDDRVRILENQVDQLRGARATTTLRAPDEASRVDGTVVSSNPAASEVFLSIGRRDNVVLGMTFEVYNNASAIRPDDGGNFPPGKATVEVVRIDRGTSVARILRESRGNPVVAGDVIANALFDPNKTYRFVVYGLFDTDGDGNFTLAESDAVRGIISEWGGSVTDEITGDTDFVVLGARPVLGPEPPSNAPTPVIMAFLDRREEQQRYDDLFDAARRTSIPVLNLNRLYTLTGLSERR